ncbi:hydantoinase B/oxoprolinase family protein [Halegenticoccus tardaugens]|uniref:hydantoinase B/oxoprolinase family protein n=1 Tax=Halegenticoccus tardaugens TaxID=2071624 RepID=UPI001E415687|nr:hydantoinase B/oxoprolinase family protein [Halegenticoccus tardaugens]
MKSPRTLLSSESDAATVEVVRNYLVSAANEMQRTLVRTAYNTIVYEILDFGLSMYDNEFNLLADSPGLALFLGSNDYSVRNTVEYMGAENLDPGDVVMVNWPYRSSSHTLDVCLFAPVFHADDLIGYVASRAHWLDMGAKDAGYTLDSTDVHQEGILFPGTKVYKRGEPDEEILELIRYNSRIPDKVVGDLNAQIAALNTGKTRLQELYGRYGPETAKACFQQVFAHGERAAREAVADLPNGSWKAVDHADNDGLTEDPVRIGIEVTVDGEDLTLDFGPSADQTDGPMNIPIGRTQAVAKFCTKTLATPLEPANEGHFAPLTVEAPEGSLYHAIYPAPTFTQWSSTLAVEVVYKALAQAIPERLAASSGGDLCSIMLYGESPETGQKFVEANNEGVGRGATADHDGANGVMHIAQTNVRNIPIEVLENKAPIEFDQVTLRQDSGGAGEYRGGLGIRRDYRFTHPSGALSIIKKTQTEGYGLKGGDPGAKNVVVLQGGDDKEFMDRVTVYADNEHLYPDVTGQRHVGMMRGQFEPGEVISNRSGGGGGYGDPFDRDPETVRQDVRDGYVSRAAAREEYGVVLTEDDEIAEQATESLRA